VNFENCCLCALTNWFVDRFSTNLYKIFLSRISQLSSKMSDIRKLLGWKSLFFNENLNFENCCFCAHWRTDSLIESLQTCIKSLFREYFISSRKWAKSQYNVFFAGKILVFNEKLWILTIAACVQSSKSIFSQILTKIIQKNTDKKFQRESKEKKTY